MQGSPQFLTDMNLCFYIWWYSSYLPVLSRLNDLHRTPLPQWQTGIFLPVIMYDLEFNLRMDSLDIPWYHSYGVLKVYHLDTSSVCVCPFRLDVIFSLEKKRREENSPQLPATHCHPCEADKAKARIKKLIVEEATERSVGTCTVASGLSCFTIYGKKAGMSAQVKLALRPWHFCLE